MKRNKILLLVFSLFIGMGIAHAAPTNSFYTNYNSIEAGAKVTATLRLNNVAAWNIKIVSNGSTNGCDTSFADATSNGGNTTKYLSVTCTSTGIGQISFRATGDATSADGSTSAINSVQVVTVTAPREKDTNNFLKSLGVKDYNLTPEFNKDTLEYTVEVPSTVNKVSIEGVAASNYAKITGLGEVEVNEGANAFEVKVTSETGSERIYKLTINVKDENPIEIKIDDHSYTIMKNAKTIEVPSNYEATSIKIKDFDIPAFYSETTKYTLVGLKDSKGTTHLAIYDKEKDTYQLYNENKSDQLLLYIAGIPEEKNGFIKSTITINNKLYECLKLNNESKFILVYAMNIMTGESDYYQYNEEQNTFSKYNDEIFELHNQEIEKYKVVIMALSATLIVFILIIMILIIRKPKKNKKIKLQDESIDIQKIDVSEKNSKIEEEKVLSKKDKKKKAKLEQQKEKTSIDENINQKEKTEEKNSKIKSSEDAIKKVDEATKIIEDFERTVQLSKEELKEKKSEMSSSNMEETMYNIFTEEKKKKKKRK